MTQKDDDNDAVMTLKEQTEQEGQAQLPEHSPTETASAFNDSNLWLSIV